MTDRRRDPLPEGYQYLDAGKTFIFCPIALVESPVSVPRKYHTSYEGGHWNVIEGEQLDNNDLWAV